MKTPVITCTLAAVISLGSAMSATAADRIDHAGIKFVVSGEPQVQRGAGSFEIAGNKFSNPATEKADADLAALERADTLLWSDDDPDIVLTGGR